MSILRTFTHQTDQDLELSTEGADLHKDVVEAELLPRGSALITRSGDLAEQGITAILHAASGSRYKKTGNFKPNLDGVVGSIHNCLHLAHRYFTRHPEVEKRVAVPFIGGKAFLSFIAEEISDFKKKDLAWTVMQASLRAAQGIHVSFIAFGEQDFRLFQEVRQALQRSGHDSESRSEVLQGSITDFSLHSCPLIVNAANMEVEFGSGVAEAIGNATGNPTAIDHEARELIVQYLAQIDPAFLS